MSTFKSVVTTLGQARIAAAIAAGTDINITQLAVGDGNGKATTPVASQTKLVKEVYRTPLNSLKLDPSHGNWVIAEAVLSASVGGFWMREMGLFSSDGALIAVCNMADTYKPTLAEGSGRTQTLRMVIAVSNTEAISLLIDDSVIMATEQYVNDLLAAHEKSRNHPDGTTTAKGFVQLSSLVSSTSETLAATPKAVKAVNDNANSRVPSTRKINGKALSADQTLTAADVGALASTGGVVTGEIKGTSAVFSGSLTQRESIASYRQLISRADAFSAYTTYNRLDQVEGMRPGSVIAVGDIAARLTTAAGDPYGRILAGVSFQYNTTGGGRLVLNARNDAGVVKSAITLDGDSGNATFAGDTEFKGLVRFSRHDGACEFSSSDAVHPLISVNYSGAGNFGFWDTTNGRWILRKRASNLTTGNADNWVIDSGLEIAGAYGLTLTTALPISSGGTGAKTATDALKNLGGLPSSGTAVAATKLATARKIAGVAFDGTKDISITAANVGAVQQGGGTGMSSNTIRIGWNGKKLLAQVDSIQMGELYYTNNPPSADAVGALPADGTAAAATKLATARKIAGVAFDGTKDISISAGNVGALPSGGTAVAATKLATARKIAGVAFDGTKDITLSNSSVGLGNVGNYASVQQGGGVGMGTNKIYIGWTGAKVKIQVDASDMGEVYTTQNKPPFVDAYSKTESNAHYIARDSVKTAGFASGNVANPYMRHEASDAVVYLADRNWSDSRFVYDVQRGSQALENAAWTAQQNWEAPTGCFMTGLNIRPDMGDCRMMGKYYRALMIRTASGSWRQVGN
ncbi:phage tail protein [Rahnella inusitata]|uniref:phage tail protein n=1 Tax=Rahnella inusitata TaxID=58169 RepID=UPI0039BECEFE